MKSKSSKYNSRRAFLKKGILASSIMIVPRHVLGGQGFLAPSDQLNIAGIGAGGKGRSDIINASVNGRERVVALCDIDPQGKHGVLDTIKNFPKANFYNDFRRLLDAEKNLDAITVSTPDHTHGIIAMEAMNRGIHVYVQKPLTHNIKEARLLTEKARENKIVSQMGNQGASNPAQLRVKEWIDSGLLGKVSEVKVWTNRPVWPQGIPKPQSDPQNKPDQLAWDLWLGPAKKSPFSSSLHPFNWRGWWEYGTGALGDMGCHIIDIPFRALGLHYPTAVECSVGSVYTQMWTPEYIPEGCPPSSSVTINFDPTEKNDIPMVMTWTDGGIRPARPDIIPVTEDLGEPGGGNGVMMIGEYGVITTGVYGKNPKLYRKGQPTLTFDQRKQTIPEYGHQRQWIDAIKAGFNSDQHKALTSSFDYAGPLTETVLMGNIAIRSYLLRKGTKRNMEYYGRKKLLWDGDNMQITNLKDANQFVGRNYRKGWEL
ncbi:MAG: Gfo/Idh/MocA family protein [Flavobacteriaceae bacterium]